MRPGKAFLKRCGLIGESGSVIKMLIEFLLIIIAVLLALIALSLIILNFQLRPPKNNKRWPKGWEDEELFH